METNREPEIVLHPSKRKTLLLLLVSLAFTAIGVAAIRTDAPGTGWLCLLVFVFLLQLTPSASYLRITPEGFLLCSLFRKAPLIRWQDVSHFRAVAPPLPPK